MNYHQVFLVLLLLTLLVACDDQAQDSVTRLRLQEVRSQEVSTDKSEVKENTQQTQVNQNKLNKEVADESVKPVKKVSLKYFNDSKDFTENVTSLLSSQLDYWQPAFNHAAKARLQDVSKAIIYFAQNDKIDNPNLDHLLYYLRAYSYFGPIDTLQAADWQALDEALLAVANMPDFHAANDAALRINEHYVVSLYRYYPEERMQARFQPHIDHLNRLLNHLSKQNMQSKQFDFTLWETLRSFGFLPYFSSRAKTEDLKKILANDQSLTNTIIAFANSQNIIRKKDQWPLKNIFWILAQTYRVIDDKAKEKMDKTAWQVAKGIKDSTSLLTAKTFFTQVYLVNTYRGKSECEKKDSFLNNKCLYPTEQEALPIKHTCSETIFIRAQAMTEKDLKTTCRKLTDKEDFFHQTLKTNRQPVPNDFNQLLRVVIFDHPAQYNINGQLIFDIGTNNGGMYIEGTPQNPENIPSFYSYEAHWLRPELVVWNLSHEYIHYLDGRYVKYDTFGHFKSHIVWWTEGLAEYISKQGEYNERAMRLLAETAENKRPTLQQIFKTAYADGVEFTYQWSFLAHVYLWQHHADDMLKLKHFLTTDYFDGYKEHLSKMERHQAGFAQFLQKTFETIDQQKLAKEGDGPRKLYHYAYRPYLTPAYLTMNSQHQHHQ
ncbi:collagenase [Aliikangiella maris]|uniref:Collagenase n=2 Tax=Aliikangiella maris TaxID=3162458 RepID=A0ABV2BUT2_9GAMM